jgi:lysophospholipid acyltransferase 5
MDATLIRLLLCVFGAMPLALLYRLVVSHAPTTLKHAYNGGVGLAFCYYMFGAEGVAHTLTLTVATYLILLVVGHFSRLVALCTVFAVNLGHLLVCYWHLQTEKYDIDFTIPQCVLCLRLISLAFDYYDGSFAVSALKSDQLTNRLPALPSPLAVVGFAFYFAAFVSGPQFTFKRYANFIDGTLAASLTTTTTDKKTNKTTTSTTTTTTALLQPTGAAWYATKCLVLALFWFAANHTLTDTFGRTTNGLFNAHAASLTSPAVNSSTADIVARYVVQL